MKSQLPHNQRKSFAKWAMPGQRTMTVDMQLRIRRAAIRRIKKLMTLAPKQ